MINDVSVYVPSAKFKEVLNTYAAGSKRRFQDSIYSRLRDVIIRAYKYTKVAARAVIAQRLGAIAARVSRSRKDGKFRFRGHVTTEKSLAYRIVQKRHYDAQGKGMPDKEAARAADKFIKAVLKTVGFIRSGWIPVLRRLNSKLKDGSGADFQAGEQKGRPKGFLRESKSAEQLMLEAGNTTKVAAPIGGEALSRAFAEVQANMERKISESMKPELDKINGKVIR
jgi:hypothetical protein